MLPNLVRDHNQVVRDRDLDYRRQFVGIEQPTGRIMRIIEDDRAALRANRRLQRIRSIRQPGGWSATTHHTARSSHQRA
jgi:hypothetical protein